MSGASLFGLLGGPLAWYAQLCAGYALASWPCFARDERRLAPLAGYEWTRPAMIATLIAGVVIGTAALLASYRGYRRARHEIAGDARHLLEKGGGRRSFLALWGMMLAAGFAATTLLTAIDLLLLPRCAG
jgi:hypothetical protein